MELLNPIACELCRTKKCKCDRKLPTCSPCSSSGATCQYPQSNKRGIPSGYISNIEQRLLETETALFEALSFINVPLHEDDNPQAEYPYRDAFSEHSATQSKEAKVEEWKRLPLTFGEQREAWLQEKLRIIKKREDPGGSVEGFPASQETENQWMGSSRLQSVGQNATQLVPQKRSITHQHSAHDMQERTLNEYQTTMSEDESLQPDLAASQTQLQAPERLLSNHLWTNPSATQEVREGSPGSIGQADSAYNLDGMVGNSQLLDGQRLSDLQTASEQAPISAGVSPSSPSPQGHRSSISSSLGRHPRASRQLSSEQWQKYF